VWKPPSFGYSGNPALRHQSLSQDYSNGDPDEVVERWCPR
jgi:hypothetical protein